MKPTTPKPQRRTPARPNDRVTDNRAAFHQRLETVRSAAFHQRLETVRSATRRTHLDEPTTDARVSA